MFVVVVWAWPNVPGNPPATVAEPFAFVHVANVLTLPLMSKDHSPAGITMPALATEAVAKTAPAALCKI